MRAGRAEEMVGGEMRGRGVGRMEEGRGWMEMVWRRSGKGGLRGSGGGAKEGGRGGG